MKKLLLPVFAALLAITSCKDDFKVSATYKDITVVYGILDVADTAHYIRIEKAFLDETKSAIEMAKVPDSSFYANLDVVLQQISSSKTDTIQLKLVDLTDEGYPKDPAGNQGFFTAPNKAYKFKHSLDPNLQYRLLITNKNSGRIDSSDLLGVVTNDSTLGATNFFISRFTNILYPIDFSKTLPVYTFSVKGTTPKNGYMLEGHLIFNYLDSNVVTGVEVRRTADFLFATVQQSEGGSFNLETPNYSIYNFLADAMGPAPAGIARLLDSCDVIVYAGSKELYNYQQVNLGQTGGLTGDQIKPNYTNMLGNNALGLLGSRTSRVYHGAYVENAAIDSLQINPITQPLNIKGRTMH